MTEDYDVSQMCGVNNSHNDIEDIIQALVAHSVPPSMATSWTGTRSMESKTTSTSQHLTCLIDSDNVAHVGKNTHVDRTFIDNGGVKSINVYRGLSVDDKLGIIITKCCNPQCQSQLPLLKARSKYKSCHHCYTYYCSSECRQRNWIDHKTKACPLGRAVSAAKSVIKRILSDESCHNTFSSLGRGGYLRMGRGCIVVWFNGCNDAEQFSDLGIRHLRNYPVYVCIKNIQILLNQFAPHSLSSIHHACTSYDPDRSIVVNVSISIDDALIKSCTAQLRHVKVHAIKKCLTISLSACYLESLTRHQLNDSLRPTSLLLTMLPGQQFKDRLDYRDRQIIFINILRKLESRGVAVRRQYPQLYKNLITFVQHNVSFGPVTIYPTDTTTGRAFVCMIAPMSDPITSDNSYRNDSSNRSSFGSFMAELEACLPDWSTSEITDL